MRITLVHRFDFGTERALVGDNLVRPEAWDALRTGTNGPFALPSSRAALEEAADARVEMRTRMERVADRLERWGARSVVSYGVGVGLPELWLRRLRPKLEITVTDYAPQTVERLASLVPEIRVERHDLLADAPLEGDVHLFHRVDTEFTNQQWRSILRHFARQRIIVVASEVIDLRRVLAEIRNWPRTRHATHAGWIRTRGAFEALWRPTHRAESIDLGDLEGWALSPKHFQS